MFNLIIDAHGEAWETPPFSSLVGRFKEYSDPIADEIDLSQPETLRRLEEVPTLLMYELGAKGPNVGSVQHGRIRNIRRIGRDVVFDFELDTEQAYLQRRELLKHAESLGIGQFERYRTHWAIKSAELPASLIETGKAEIERRTVGSVAADYIEALREGNTEEFHEFRMEIEGFSPSIEKAKSLLPALMLEDPFPELYSMLDIAPHTVEGRSVVESVLAHYRESKENLKDRSFYWLSFFERYGSLTEGNILEDIIDGCSERLRDLGAKSRGDELDVSEIALTLWRCGRSRASLINLHREVAVLMDLLYWEQDGDGYWTELIGDTEQKSVRTTALATVALQRLGDDSYHDDIHSAIVWLVGQIQVQTGALPGFEDDGEPDLISTVLTMEAIRRSNKAEDLQHVLSRGDAWIVSQQNPLGKWQSEGFQDAETTHLVLSYLLRRKEVLPQVDGFLLMARDFFRKAEELRFEGGANNRRLSAIAVVHAVEMFLYGLFERREDLGLSAYKENGVETLGPREGLRRLQDALRRIGRLGEHQLLPRRDQLSSLISRRDGIIHRAHEISDAELEEGIRQARGFIEKIGADLLDLNLLE